MALEACRAARDQNAVLIDSDNVFGPRNLQHMNDGRARCTGAVLNDLDILNALADNLQSVQHARQHDDGRAVLVVVEHGDIELALEFGLNFKALGAADILKVDAAERRGDSLDGSDNFLFGFGIQADGKCIDAAELLEEDAFSLHDGQAGLGADVAQAQHCRTVGDDRNGAALHRVGVDVVGICFDFTAGFGHAGGVGSRECVTVLAFAKALHGDFTGEFAVKFQGCFVVIHTVCLLYMVLLSARPLDRGRLCPALCLAFTSLLFLRRGQGIPLRGYVFPS